MYPFPICFYGSRTLNFEVCICFFLFYCKGGVCRYISIRTENVDLTIIEYLVAEDIVFNIICGYSNSGRLQTEVECVNAGDDGTVYTIPYTVYYDQNSTILVHTSSIHNIAISVHINLNSSNHVLCVR